jgi:hypothetical protein
MRRVMPTFAVLCALTAVAAQQSPKPLRFEVASIRSSERPTPD